MGNDVERSTPLRFRSTPVLSSASLTSSSRVDREIAEGQISTSFSPQSNSTVQENAYPIPTLEEMALDENSNVPTSMSLQNEPQSLIIYKLVVCKRLSVAQWKLVDIRALT
ncbi:hypothetical protein L5515_017429 [Caenorhabditis briggsae]|uniref:Uncharacterized protein n=1 Tax=Caenorhabditis briggsae TaxID=6238 RepID=A0AAE9FE76_CAEBR|nr:hypothetical protein L5515_017429 [Caenorhabditis briggsae]